MVGAIVIAVSLLAVIGGVREAALVREDEQSLVVPGELVAVGSGSWRLQCTGNSSSTGPTVVLEAGLGESGMTWAGIQPELAEGARVCSYDRAGYGWSTPASAQDALARSEQLYALLEAADVPGPYVLVAHSLGSFVSRLFAAQHPREVAAVVLVDPTNEKTLTSLGPPVLQLVVTRAQALALRVGMLRPLVPELIAGEAGAAPPEELLRLGTFLYRADTVDTSAEELAVSLQSAGQVTDHPISKTVPLVVILTSDSMGDAPHFEALTEDVRIVDAGHADHYVHYSNPDVVIDTVRELVEDLTP